LPEEVQSYISKIEIEFYDQIQGSLAVSCMLVSVFGLVLILNYFDWMPFRPQSTIALVLGAVFLCWPWVHYYFKWKRNADQYLDLHRAGEGIRSEWEVNYVVDRKSKAEEATAK
jgi:hypothetical protein